MSGRGEESDSDAPEELTTLQGIEKDEEIRKVERENKARVVREGKERRRQWAQKLTPRPTRNDESIEDIKEPENAQESKDNGGMLPDEIVKILAAREKKVFSSDSEEEHEKKPTSKKKRSKSSGSGPVILKDLPPPPCLENSLEFLKKRKMQEALSGLSTRSSTPQSSFFKPSPSRSKASLTPRSSSKSRDQNEPKREPTDSEIVPQELR